MTPSEEKHNELTLSRVSAFTELFGRRPQGYFPSKDLAKEPNEKFIIDVYTFYLDTTEGRVTAAVTNGMSDQRMVEADSPKEWARHELVQYFRDCTRAHAQRLRDMAWLPLHDGFLLEAHHSVSWEHPAIEGTPWKHAFFLEPLLTPHREFGFEVEHEHVSLLWHIPISDKERAFKLKYGSNELISRMEEVGLPWIFDEKNRPSLV